MNVLIGIPVTLLYGGLFLLARVLHAFGMLARSKVGVLGATLN